MTPHPDDTIAAVASAPGPGLRAVVRVTGPATRAVVDAVFRPDPESPPRPLVSGNLHLTGVSAPLPADRYFWPGPRTYTGQDLAEIHTLSAPPLVERLVADLLTAGARAAGPGEFTLRAFLAGKKDLPQAEAVLAVIDARSDADLDAALAQLAGGVTRPLEELRNDLLNLLADVEAALDFADEDIEFVEQPALLTRLAAGIAHLTNLGRQLDDRTVSNRGVRVALVGEPNAGKSSLFNALAGADAAIVSGTPGTTRDYLTRVIDLDGVTAELVDTAGWESAADTIAEQAQRLAADQAGRADVILWCVPVGAEFDPATAARLVRGTAAEVVRVRTKADAGGFGPDPRVVPSSAVAAGGTAVLRATLADVVRAVSRPPLAPSQSRCRAHVERAVRHLRAAHQTALFSDPPELVAAALRAALDEVGEVAGAVHTDDLLDRIFSRFCIGK